MEELKKTDEEIAEQCASPRPSEPFTLYRIERKGGEYKRVPKGEYRMCLLTLKEQMDALREAQEYVEKVGEDQKQFRDIYGNIQGLALIAKALVHAKRHERADGTEVDVPVCTEIRQVLLRFNEADIAACLNMYEVVRYLYNPLITFKQGEVDRWIERLSHPVKGADFLGQLDSSQYRGLLLSMACRARDLTPTRFQTPDQLLNSSESGQETSSPGTTTTSGLLSSLGMAGLAPVSSPDDVSIAEMDDGTDVPTDRAQARELGERLSEDAPELDPDDDG